MHLLAAIVLIVWSLVFVQTLVNLRSVPRLRRERAPASSPFVSIVVPARNEARVIERSVRSFLAQDYDRFEVIVVNDRSTDETGARLSSIADPRLTVIEGSETPAGWLGKPWALEQGRLAARGELLLFVDADLMYAPDTVGAAVGECERSGAAMLALFPHVEMRTFAEHVGMPMLAIAAYCGMPLWRANRSASPRLALGGGSGNLIRRAALESIGGFGAIRDAVIDDIGIARALRAAKLPTRIARADDLISVRMYHGAREIVQGFTKNAFPSVGRSYPAAAAMLLLIALLHLFPYAFALTGDAFALAVVAIITLTRVLLFRSLRYSLLNAIFLHPLMVLFWAYIFLRSMWFTGVRNELRWRGRTYDAAQTRGA